MHWISMVIVLIFIPLFFQNHKNRTKRESKFPPSPPKLPILGNLHQLGQLRHRSLQKLSQKYGEIMLLQLGTIPTIVVSSADMAIQVLKTHDLHCCSRPISAGSKKLSYNHLDVVFSPPSESWKERRKLIINGLLGPRKQHLFQQARREHIDHLITSLSQSSPNPVDFTEIVFVLMDRVLGTAAFGMSYDGNQFKIQAVGEIVKNAVKMADLSAEDFFPFGGRIIDNFMGVHDHAERCFGALDGHFQQLIDHHRNSSGTKSKHEDFVDTLIGLAKGQAGISTLTDDHMKALFMNIFLAGIDTTSITIVWAMSELMQHPETMHKLQEEIRGLVGSKIRVEEEDLVNLKYLKLVVKETLRLHPPVTLLVPHKTLQHFTINGYDIEPETMILVNLWAMGRDPKIWDNPYEFYPERFEGKHIEFKGQDFMFLPFGSGRRICPGIVSGTTTVEFTLANLLYRLDWELPNGMRKEDMNMEEEGSLTAHKKTPLFLVPTEYKEKP